MKVSLPKIEYVAGYKHGYDDCIADLEGLPHGYKTPPSNKESVDFAKACAEYLRKKYL